MQEVSNDRKAWVGARGRMLGLPMAAPRTPRIEPGLLAASVNQDCHF